VSFNDLERLEVSVLENGNSSRSPPSCAAAGRWAGALAVYRCQACLLPLTYPACLLLLLLPWASRPCLGLVIPVRRVGLQALSWPRYASTRRGASRPCLGLVMPVGKRRASRPCLGLVMTGLVGRRPLGLSGPPWASLGLPTYHCCQVYGGGGVSRHPPCKKGGGFIGRASSFSPLF